MSKKNIQQYSKSSFSNNEEQNNDYESILSEGEQVIKVARISLWNYLNNFISMGIWFFLIMFALFYINYDNLMLWAGDGYSGLMPEQRYKFFYMIASYADNWWFHLLKLLPCFFLYSHIQSLLMGYVAIKLILTNKQVIVSAGLISHELIDLPLNRIESVRLSQSVKGKFFGYGDLTFIGMGDSITVMQGIKDPMEFKKMFNFYKKKLEEQNITDKKELSI